MDSYTYWHHSSGVQRSANTIRLDKTVMKRGGPVKIKTAKLLKADNNKSIIVCFALGLTLFWCLSSLTLQANAIHCYQCLSAYDPGCDESFSGRANYTGTTECEPATAKVCRKVVQYIEDTKVVIRSCGHIVSDNKTGCSKHAGSQGIMVETCNCSEDKCNFATTSFVPNIAMALLLSAAFLPFNYFTFSSLSNS